MEEQWDVEDATIAVDEVIEADPFVLINCFVYDVDFLLIVKRKTNTLLELSVVKEDIHTFLLLGRELIFFLEASAHQIALKLKLKTEVRLHTLAIE